MYKKEKTCKCIKDYSFEDIQFHKGMEYQVDEFLMYYQVFQNRGYDKYVIINEEYEFSKYFSLIT